MKEAGLFNCIFEIDLGNSTYDFKKFSLNDLFARVKDLITWCHDNLHENARVCDKKSL